MKRGLIVFLLSLLSWVPSQGQSSRSGNIVASGKYIITQVCDSVGSDSFNAIYQVTSAKTLKVIQYRDFDWNRYTPVNLVDSGCVFCDTTCQGGVSIGDPIGGGDPYEVLFVDGGGNLAQSDSFTYQNQILTSAHRLTFANRSPQLAAGYLETDASDNLVLKFTGGSGKEFRLIDQSNVLIRGSFGGNPGQAVQINYGAGVNSTLTTKVALVVHGSAGQSADLSQWRNNAGDTLLTIDNDGNVGINAPNPNSTFQSNGSFSTAYRLTNVATTLGSKDYLLECDGTYTVDLPTAVGITGRHYVIKNSGVGTITIDPNGAETIDGNLTLPATAGEAYTIVSNGSNWIII